MQLANLPVVLTLSNQLGGIPYSYQVFSNVSFLFLLSTRRTSVTYLNQPVLPVWELNGQRAIDLGSERVHQQ